MTFSVLSSINHYSAQSGHTVAGFARTEESLLSNRQFSEPSVSVTAVESQVSLQSENTLRYFIPYTDAFNREILERVAISDAATTAQRQDPDEQPQQLTPSEEAAQQHLEQQRQQARDTAEQEAQVQEREQKEIAELAARDREVRAHEQAHASVGGQYAGSARLEYQRGPDGVSYAIAGEVSIDMSREVSPQETLRKAQVVHRAALAPADPSPQDRRVAAQATQLEAQATREIVAAQQDALASSSDSMTATNTVSGNTDANSGGLAMGVDPVVESASVVENTRSFSVNGSLALSQISSRTYQSVANLADLERGMGSRLDDIA